MKISLGCDHGGLELKNKIKDHLLSLGHEVLDCGTYSNESRAKIGAATAVSNLGKHLSDETRAKIGAASAIFMRGKHFSEEHRAKIGTALRGKFCGKHWRKNPVTGKREWYE